MSEGASTLGIDLGGTKILSVCLDADFKVVGRDQRPTDAHAGPEVVIQRMMESGWAAAVGRRLLAVGVSAPGPSNPDLGIVTTPPNLPGWRDVPLASLISKQMGLPAWIENDANAGAFAEHRIGAGRGSRHMIMVAAGTGIGGGLILDGRLYHGASGGAGEIGHMQLDTEGRPCTCGRRGCLEALASGWALDLDADSLARAEPEGAVAQIARREGVDPNARILDLAAEAGDAAATEVLRRAGRFLGDGLTNLVNLFNPEVVVIGGSLRKSEHYLQTALAVVNEEAFPQHRADVRFVEAELGDEAPAIGAALLARDRLREKQES
jgi:glucokinase